MRCCKVAPSCQLITKYSLLRFSKDNGSTCGTYCDTTRLPSHSSFSKPLQLSISVAKSGCSVLSTNNCLVSVLRTLYSKLARDSCRISSTSKSSINSPTLNFGGSVKCLPPAMRSLNESAPSSLILMMTAVELSALCCLIAVLVRCSATICTLSNLLKPA